MLDPVLGIIFNLVQTVFQLRLVDIAKVRLLLDLGEDRRKRL
jgi:hypothetical protein